MVKKIDFLSPEALLQAEIFGDGNGGGGSNIIDASSYIDVTDNSDFIPNVHAYYNTTTQSGLFYVMFESSSQNCSVTVSIPNIETNISDFLSSNNTATKNGNNTIIFNTVTTNEYITVIGQFGAIVS